MESSSIPSLTPHKYPLWIVLPFLLAFVPLIYFSTELPEYFKLRAMIKSADFALKNKEYIKAINSYNELLQRMPDSAKIKLRLAQSCFALKDPAVAGLALKLLKGLKINNEDWNELIVYMPEEYKIYFESKKG